MLLRFCQLHNNLPPVNLPSITSLRSSNIVRGYDYHIKSHCPGTLRQKLWSFIKATTLRKHVCLYLKDNENLIIINHTILTILVNNYLLRFRHASLILLGHYIKVVEAYSIYRVDNWRVKCWIKLLAWGPSSQKEGEDWLTFTLKT